MAFVAVPAVIGGGAAIAAATTRIRRWTRDGDDDDDGDGFRGYKKVKDSRLAAWALSKMYDRATQKIVEKALDAIERRADERAAADAGRRGAEMR